MTDSDSLSLRIAIDQLVSVGEDHYAIWVLESPFPGGYVHHDCPLDDELMGIWQSWREFFSLRGLPNVPHVPSAYVPQFVLEDSLAAMLPKTDQPGSRTSRLMQGMGIALWRWLFSGVIQQSMERSMGMAMGQDKPLRLRLELRTPKLINLPWEVMQAQAGRPAVSLSQKILFSRTTSAVDPLPPFELDHALRVLLVLGQDVPDPSGTENRRDQGQVLQLQDEAQVLTNILEQGTSGIGRGAFNKVHCQVHALVEPDPAAMIRELESGQYNIFFYAGHGVPAPDGGLLFVRSGNPLNGTELAQVLTRCQIRLAVFNTCWGAQPDQRDRQVIPRSSLAEVLLHHGVPAVVAMRDSIADEEALSFIQLFAQQLAERKPVDQAVAIARQHLLTLYRFNQPAWTLPVLYMHPDFDGAILEPVQEDVTRIPGEEYSQQGVALRYVENPTAVWPIHDGFMRIGRLPDNDLVISEPWVSSRHAEIFCRNVFEAGTVQPNYFLRDASRYGTYYYLEGQWHHVHRDEVPLSLGMRVRFGSKEGQPMEFVIE
ncbi:hypothetical protein C7271_13315 [filamentous cyanobacterium CCP5]|nr:hypothetical protein C7271_13315 [filamentous cyanobacterium CCP5]